MREPRNPMARTSASLGLLGLAALLPLSEIHGGPFKITADGLALTTAPQSDGTALVGGAFANISGQMRPYLVRLNPEGTFDTSLGTLVNNTVDCISVQEDGKVLLGGGFNRLGQLLQTRVYLGRVTTQGALDTAFDANVTSGGFAACVDHLILQPDGRIVVAGSFTSLGGQSCHGLGRVNADGTLDASFTPTALGTMQVMALALQQDGKLLVGGGAGGLLAQTNLLRLNADGTLDTSFSSAPGGAKAGDVASVNALALQPDGKILVGGSFVRMGGRNCTNLARLSSNGTGDSTFKGRTDRSVRALALQTDGKILAGGDFTSLDGQSRAGFGRLNSDGTLDSAYAAGSYASVFSIALRPDGQVLLAGGSALPFGTTNGYVQGLSAANSATQTVQCDGSSVLWQRGGSSPEVSRVSFEFSTNSSSWNKLGDGTRVTGGWQLAGVAVPAAATVRARGFVPGCGNGSEWTAQTLARPAPVILSGTNLCLRTARFGFDIRGGVGWSVVVERSADLRQWTPVVTNCMASEQFHFEEDARAGTSGCFYRVRLN